MSEFANIPCPACGGAVPVPEDMQEAAGDLVKLRAEFTRLLREKTRLENELSGQREQEPEAVAVRELLDYWKLKCNHPRAKTPLAGERATKVRARLREGFSADDLKKAIDGAARFPFVGPQGRKAHGSDKERHDNLALIMRSEETVERFVRYADMPTDQPAPSRPGRPLEPAVVMGRDYEDGEKPRRYPGGLDAVLRALAAAQCDFRGSGGNYMASCPAHEDRSPSLHLTERADGGVLVFCHAGCETRRVLEVLGLDFADIGAFTDVGRARPGGGQLNLETAA